MTKVSCYEWDKLIRTMFEIKISVNLQLDTYMFTILLKKVNARNYGHIQETGRMSLVIHK